MKKENYYPKHHQKCTFFNHRNMQKSHRLNFLLALGERKTDVEFSELFVRKKSKTFLREEKFESLPNHAKNEHLSPF